MVDKQELKSFLEEKFTDDPLMKEVRDLNLYDEIYKNGFLDNLNIRDTYSLPQAAEMLGMKDYALRNNLHRHSLDQYFEPIKVGNQYKVDYKGIFKFRLMEVLTDKAGKTPKDIAKCVGTIPTSGFVHRRGSWNNQNVSNEPDLAANQQELNNKLNSIERNIWLMRFEKEVDNFKYSYEQAKRSIIDWENKVALIGIEIENLELQKQLKKQEEKTQAVIRESHKKIGGVNGNSIGFSFKNLFKSKSVDYDKEISGVISQIDSQMLNFTPDQTIEKNLKRLKEQLKELQQEKESLILEAQQKELEYNERKNKYFMAKKQFDSLFSNSTKEYLIEDNQNRGPKE
ncbi:hypothetical protein AAGG74_17280 [Bacillus mexicanus]|uniref:coiled-coil domain-containing protein n=1 Tax=Bacillus mexicanus TaxID=2834415 RepID=UPI003D2302F4